MRLNGLVLSGGKSTRMGRDKGALVYRDGLDQRSRCHGILNEFCDSVWISCRAEQVPSIPRGLPIIEDAVEGDGPGVGMLSAFETDGEAAWLVLACDFPNVDRSSVLRLIGARRRERAATVYVNSSGMIEPLFGIWESRSLWNLSSRFATGRFSPREALEALDCELLAPLGPEVLLNLNSREDFAI